MESKSDGRPISLILNQFIYLRHFMGLAHIQVSCFIERLRILAISVIITP